MMPGIMSRLHRQTDPLRSAPSALVAFAVALPLAVASPALGWHTSGHVKVARAAAAAQPADVPAFFRAGADTIGQAAVDPDMMKDSATPRLRTVEYPEHYIDWEVVDRISLPDDRHAFMAYLAERKVTPRDAGFVPYAIVEGVERLTIAFAEHRRWPDDPRIQQKILLYAGLLSHYASDLQQPLHTTIDHDGRALPDGTSPQTGIHTIVDGLFDTIPLDLEGWTPKIPIQAYEDHWLAIKAELGSSHALVDEVYRLEPLMRANVDRGDAPPAPELVAFTTQRFEVTGLWLANLFYTAWQRSAAIQLPPWHHRDPPPPSTPVPTPTPGAEVILTPRQPGGG
jgi:hypothetical protein